MLLVFAAIPCAGSGCGRPLSMADPAVRIEPAKLAALPATVQEFELDDRSDLTRKPQWEREAAQSVNDSIACRLAANGARSFLRIHPDPTEATYRQFERWTKEALWEIELTLTHKIPPPHKAVTEWQFHAPLDRVRRALKAEFALISFFRDGAHTTLRDVSNVLGPVSTSLIRGALACVVDLSSGRITWCQRQSIDITLRTRPEAQLVVDDLLRGFGDVSTRQWASGRGLIPVGQGNDCGALERVGAYRE